MLEFFTLSNGSRIKVMHFLPGIFCSWGFQGEESHDAKRSAEATEKRKREPERKVKFTLSTQLIILNYPTYYNGCATVLPQQFLTPYGSLFSLCRKNLNQIYKGSIETSNENWKRNHRDWGQAASPVSNFPLIFWSHVNSVRHWLSGGISWLVSSAFVTVCSWKTIEIWKAKRSLHIYKKLDI